MQKTVLIEASADRVWTFLTSTAYMQQWMSREALAIETPWQVGGPFCMRGVIHGFHFENTGQLLAFEAPKTFAYSHLSSISELPDLPENYSKVHFELTAVAHQTQLTLTLSQFPTESIYKHLALYWNATLEILREMIERSENLSSDLPI